jgi:group I intron endonuclease
MSIEGKIYCAHCIFTGKKYIGQTVSVFDYRVSRHFALSKNYNHKFARALKKYGRDGFIWGIIEECEEEELNEREIFWIGVYGTYKKGYNSTTGGNQGREYCTKEFLIEKPNGKTELIKNLTKYCRENNLRRTSMRATLIGKCLTHKGYKIIPRTTDEIERYNKTRETAQNNIKLNAEKIKKFAHENYSKEYLIEKPNGERELIRNLSWFCRQNNLSTAYLIKTLKGKAISNKGYKIIPRTEEEIERYNTERKIREDNTRKSLPGEKNGRAILNWDKVNEIRKLHKNKTYKNKELANMFGIKLSSLEKIISNTTWTV